TGRHSFQSGQPVGGCHRNSEPFDDGGGRTALAAGGRRGGEGFGEIHRLVPPGGRVLFHPWGVGLGPCIGPGTGQVENEASFPAASSQRHRGLGSPFPAPSNFASGGKIEESI